MATTFAAQMVEKYEALLAANVGVASVTIDGVSVSYADVEAAYRRWLRTYNRERGRRPTAATIRLDGF